MKLIYLTALHNSGSTVISLVANSHPDMVSPGEMTGPGGRLHGPDGPLCSCGRVVAECPFWLAVGKLHIANRHPWRPAAWGLEYEFEGHPYLSRLAFGRPGPKGLRDRVMERFPFVNGKLKDLYERNRCFVQLILDVSGKETVFDASKHPERIVHFSRIRAIDLRVVHLVRDPRGWCNSRKRRSGEKPRQAAVRWVKRNRYIDRLVGGLPQEKHVRIRYEDFCRSPQEVMDRIYSLASLPSAPVADDLRTIAHHVLGNRMRIRRDAAVVHDLSWKDELDRSEITAIEKITRPAARRYGYDF